MAREVDIEEAAAALDAGAFVLDVREPDEYLGGHVPGAVNIPLGHVVERHRELPDRGTIYAICGSGRRSLQAADLLLQHGVDTVNVRGGTTAWVDSGRAIDEGSGADERGS